MVAPPFLRFAIDLEDVELMEEETADPEESSQPVTYHVYHLLFSHFPRNPRLWGGLSSIRTSEESRKIPLHEDLVRLVRTF
jgi:hypothetical protein